MGKNTVKAEHFRGFLNLLKCSAFSVSCCPCRSMAMHPQKAIVAEYRAIVAEFAPSPEKTVAR